MQQDLTLLKGKRKTPQQKGLYRCMSKIIIAETPTTSNNSELGAGFGHSLAKSRAPNLASVPSLSIGTLKSPKPYLTATTSRKIYETLLKIYPDKIVFYTWKYPMIVKNEENKPKMPKTKPTLSQQIETLNASIRRTKREIADIVDCNEFDLFATFTFDPKKHPECANWDYSKKKIIQWLNKQQARHGAFRYLLVPERQKNGNLHFHALLGGFTGKIKATNIRGTGEFQRQCYKIISWEKSNGFADAEQISNKQAIGRYIGKYLQKNITPEELITQKNGKRYFSSKGLKKPIKQYNLSYQDIQEKYIFNPAQTYYYENDYMKIQQIILL